MKASEFLSGGGEMGAIIRAYDWASSPIGTIETWPQSLLTTLSIILNSNFPMFLFWGEHHICFYNDGYRPSLGNDGKHPYAIGSPGENVWPEIWNDIKPLIDEVMAGGKASWSEDQLLPIYRNGRLEDVYWTFSYSPVKVESGKIGGVFVTCTETTEKVKSFQKLEESENLLRFAIEATELGTWDYNPRTNRFTGNQRLKEWFGLPHESEIELPSAIDVIAEADKFRVANAISAALDYKSGGNYDEEYTIIHPKTKERKVVRAKGKAWFDDQKIAYRFNGTLQDITEQFTSRKKLENSEHRLHLLIEESPVRIIFLTGRDMVIDLANEIVLKSWGKDKSIIGLPLKQAFPELESKYFLELLDKVYTTGEPLSMKGASVRYRLNGEIVQYYYDFWYKPMFNDYGEVYGILSTAVDVTEKIIAQYKLEKSEQNFRNIILQAPVAMCIFKGKDFIVEIANDLMLQLWGGTSDKIIGKPIFEGLPEVKNQGFEDLLNKVFITGETHKALEVPVIVPRDSQSETVYIDFVYEAFRDENGVISGVMAVVIDVTEQVLSRKEIEEAQQKARLAIESADLGPYEVDLLSNSIKTSDRFNAIWGIKGEVTREKVIEFIHPEDRIIREEAHADALATGNLHYEARIIQKDNSVHWVKIKGRILFDENQKPITLLGVIQDITEQKRFAEELTRQVNERTLQLQRSNDDLLQFAHVASHDLKEPIRKIKIFTNMIESDYAVNIPERGLAYLAKVQNAADRMFSMVEGVLAYSTVNSEERPIETVDLGVIFDHIETDLEIIMSQKQAVLKREKLPQIEGATVLLYQLFYNLINNALKFSKEDKAPLIEVSSSYSRREGVEYLRIRVEDNGIGIDPDYSHKIFDAFTRLNTKDKYEGTGLGLALCKKIVERHHGTISAEGKIGKGTVFIIELPIRQIQRIL